ncbi:hypothetical protein K2173_022151 [Erythroxylum novogranatense]|uniref:Uncharacterized protein n=1 Tax=Erythroxylum novogranatense TaxID=1862640 RepID=A0AAV8STD9_9ROSI|nr:hypothetical protein K2173_022151 [Erythroxylum novogranatense]
MEDSARTGLYDLLASRKAEEAACRRFQAAAWLDGLVGPLDISIYPSENEFISRLRNGLILCNAINKVHPGAVPKVVENHTPLHSLIRETQPLPAYQYFENVRNFIVAVEELKLPAFEASDLERDTLEAGSVAKVVDCILALKSYHEYQQLDSGNASYRPVRSPMVMQSICRNNSRHTSLDTCRRLDMTAARGKKLLAEDETRKRREHTVKLLSEHINDTKENIDGNLLTSLSMFNMDSERLFARIIPSILEYKWQKKCPEKSLFEDFLKHNASSPPHSPRPSNSGLGDIENDHTSSRNANYKQKQLLRIQEKELLDLKTLLKTTKKEFEDLQSQLQRDLKELGYHVEEMSTAALGYHRVLNENRNLYNMVQDLKGNIRVYCRIRPVFGSERNSVIDFVGKDGSLVILDPVKPPKDGRKNFHFNRVFGPTAAQDEVFKDIQPLIRSVMDGYNVCIFAYGQTGSGKTYTMTGTSSGSTKDMGINYLALNDLFELSNERKDVTNYEIQVQMVEIYNEQVRDLLVNDSSTTKYPSIFNIRSTGETGLNLPDAKMHTVKSTDDVLNLMKLGEENRVVSFTAMNNRSSRSHSVLSVHVHGKDISGSNLRSCLHLVDLAGSERVDKSEVTGDRLREAQYINKSLSSLGDVITALAQKSAHVPYRNSKLTLLLQDSLGGRAKTLMFAHVSPEGDSYSETISTLKFAQRVSTVELGAARANKESSEIMQLKEQVENLKKALASKETENKVKEPKSPSGKPKSFNERTPPRVRRLSIENGSSMKSGKNMKSVDYKGLVTPSVSSRRLSLEGPRYGKKDEPDNIGQKLYIEAVAKQTYLQSQDPEAMTKIYGNSVDDNPTMKVYHLNAPRSPTSSSSYQKHNAKRDSKTQIPTLQFQVTPEPKVATRHQIQFLFQSELSVPTDTRVCNLSDSANGKGSQIRKSLRTIGKLVNGSDKRIQHNLADRQYVTNCTNNNVDAKSPPTANARALRRRSLTGGQTSESDRSCRSSVGGKLTDYGKRNKFVFVTKLLYDSRRNAKTPPPIHSSASKTAKRWF